MALTFFIVTFLLQMQFLWKYIDDLVGKGLSTLIIFKLLLYATATFVPLSLPLAILLASLMAFGSLGENYELTAIKSAGISLTRIMQPLIIFIALVSISAFFYSNYTMPYFNLKMRTLIFEIQQQKQELVIKEGVYTNLGNYAIKTQKKDSKSNLMYNISIYDHSNNQGNTNITMADSGYLKMSSDKRYLEVTLFKGESYTDDISRDRQRSFSQRSYPFRRDKFSKQVVNIPMIGYDLQKSDESLFKSNFMMLNIKQLQHGIDSINKDVRQEYSNLSTRILLSNYNHNIVHNVPETTKKKTSDSIIKRNSAKLRVMYYMLTDEDKVTTLGSAIDDARNTKIFISSEAPNINSKVAYLRRYEIEWHKKFTLSLACIIFFFIGAPLGAIIRKGGLGLPLVIAVVFFIIYYIITLSGEKLVRGSYIPPHIGVWIASMILLPLGIFLTIKATNDSAVLNLDSYYKVFQKIKNLKIWKNIFRKVK